MRTIVFSDTHLSKKFDQRKFSYLIKIISWAERVIINGDFWDGYLCSFSEFCNSSWKKLFPLLKAKKTIFLYGNHDRKIWMDKKARLFSTIQSESFEIKVNNQIFHIEHGDRIAPAFDDRYPWVPTPGFLVDFFVRLREEIPLSFFGKRFLKFYSPQNKKMKNWVKRNFGNQKILVCGHSHLLENDISTSFINTGFIRHGYGQYLKIDGDLWELIDERY